ncbi:MAG TPA: sulfite exporter TauE/SafE family protein [Rhizobacter sp.]|nr:sulfite exporter TauE/SafE family protein [Rhizobacter sp.]
MTPELWLLVGGAVVAGFVQGLSGFAFGMVAMSIWVWGVEPRVATVMAVSGGLTGQIVAAVSMRRGLRLAMLWPFLAGALVGIPIGVALVPHMNAALFKLTLGALLVVFCPAMLLAPRFPRVQFGGRVADGVAGAAGGVMGGIGGFTGVVPTLWCTLRGYEKDVQRSLIQNFNLAALTMTLAAYFASGNVTREMLPMFALVAPALLIPSLLGARIYVGLSETAFRRVVLALLTASGVTMVLSSLPAVL